MADSTINMILQVGSFSEATLEIEVNWDYNSLGEVSVNDFYAYHVTMDNSANITFERIPYWLHKLVELELEEYHEDIINKMD